MTANDVLLPVAGDTAKRSHRRHEIRLRISKVGVTLFTASMAMIFLLPFLYMLLTSFKDSDQMTALNAPLYPATQEMYTASDGQQYVVYEVPTSSGTQELALKVPRRTNSRSEEHTSELQSRQYLVCRL